MTGSSSRLRLLAAACLALAALAPLGARGQDVRAPLLLTPPPAIQDGAPSGAGDPGGETVRQPSIAAGPLAAPQPDAMGLVDSRSGGFPETLWQGSRLETARVLLGGLPRHYAAVSARRLAIRFLLSAAPPPATEAADAGAPPASGLLEARVAALAALGDWTDALALIDLVPAEARSPVLQRSRLDGLLMTRKIDAACSEVQSGLSRGPDPALQKIQVLCQFATGQSAAAGLSIGILREQGTEDRAFYWAADLVQDTVEPMPPDVVSARGAVSPLILALLRQADRPLPSAVLDSGDPNALIVAAQMATAERPGTAAPSRETGKTGSGKAAAEKGTIDKVVRPETSDETRIIPVERAVAAGLAEPAVLRGLYAKVAVGPEALNRERIGLETAGQRAATYQLAVSQTVPGARAEVIARAFGLAQPKPGVAQSVPPILQAMVYLPLVLEITPAADLAWFAGTAVRVIAGAEAAGLADPSNGGQTLAAVRQSWLDLAQSTAAAAADAANANDRLWPYRQMLSSGAFSRAGLQSWLAAQADIPQADLLVRRRLVLGLLSDLGDGVTLADWEPLIAAGPAPAEPSVRPDPVAARALRLAATLHRVGEGVALALDLLGYQGMSAPDELATGEAIAGLSALGRGQDARAIAIETALQRGL